MMPTISACSPCGERGVDVGGQLTRLGAAPDDVLDLREARAAFLLVRRREAGQLVDQLALVEDDLEDVLRARVGGEALQRADDSARSVPSGSADAVSPARSNIASSGSVARSHIAWNSSALSLKCQ